VSTSEAKRQVDVSDVLSALAALLSDQLTCNRCASQTNQPRSPRELPSAGQVPNQNVPTPTLNSTTAALLANNTEPTPVNSGAAGELMRYILHDVRKLKAAIIRQVAARADSAKRLEADELHQRKNGRWTLHRLPTLSDDNDDNIDDERRLSLGRHVRCETSQFRLPTNETCSDYHRVSGAVRSKCDDDEIDDGQGVMDRTERRKSTTHDSLQSPTTHRVSSRQNDSMDTNRKNYDHSAGTWPPPRHQYQPRRAPPEQFSMTGPASSQRNAHDQLDPRQALPPSYQQCSPQQQQHPQVAQRPSQQQAQPQMPSYPHQVPEQTQSSIFTPIHQMSPAAQRQPLVFVPLRNHRHHHQQQQQQPQDRRQFHSTDVATRLGKLAHSQSQRLRDAVKLAKQTRNLTAQIYERQKHVIVGHGSV